MLRSCAILASALLAGCSAFQADPTVETCATVASEICPVCPAPITQQCPEPQVVEKIVTITKPAPVITPTPVATTAGKQHLPIIGGVEWATVEPGDVRLEARIDTGAATTSIHAEDIQLLEKDGKRWVSFAIVDPASGEKVQFEQRLRRTVRIRQGDSQTTERRYVVRLWITLGETRTQVEVTLADREQMEYPLLVGRNLLVDSMIVDVSRKHLSSR